MLLKGGEIKIIPTQGVKIEIDSIKNRILNQNTLGKDTELLVKEALNIIDITYINDVFNDIFPAIDYFQELESKVISEQEIKDLSEKASNINKFIYIKFKHDNLLVINTCLLFIYHISLECDGLINTFGFGQYRWLKEKSYTNNTFKKLLDENISIAQYGERK